MIVMIDFQGHPIRYDELGVYDEVIAQERCVKLDLQVQTKDSRGAWRQLGSAKLDEDSLGWRSGLRAGAQQLQDLHVKASDPHYDAKLFVCAHPYGTGSLHCEFGGAETIAALLLEKCRVSWRGGWAVFCRLRAWKGLCCRAGSGSHQKLVRSRALSIQKWFRRSDMWCFFQLDLSIKQALFFAQAGRRKFGRASQNPSDSFSKWFGTIVPANIPDSTAWWRRQARELATICDDTECGLMQSMVTITSAWPPAYCFIVSS